MRIFLDDFRLPHDCVTYMQARIGKLNPIYLQEWLVVKNYDEFVKAVSENIDIITHVSFDHDLADEHYAPETWATGGDYMYTEKTGAECAKWMKEFYKKNQTDLPIIFVHSMNPIGTQNIINAFK